MSKSSKGETSICRWSRFSKLNNNHCSFRKKSTFSFWNSCKNTEACLSKRRQTFQDKTRNGGITILKSHFRASPTGLTFLDLICRSLRKLGDNDLRQRFIIILRLPRGSKDLFYTTRLPPYDPCQTQDAIFSQHISLTSTPESHKRVRIAVA